MEIYTIYVATNKVNGKQYVGFDSKWPRRQRYHLLNAKNNPKQAFGRALAKHGSDNFVWEILYQSRDSQYTLSVMESHFIAENQSFLPRGYNMTVGGEGTLGCKQSTETRAKRSAAHKGKKLSIETIAKRVATRKGYKHSVETTAKISTANTGKKHSAETRSKWSTTRKGKLTSRSKPVSTPYGIFESLSKASVTLNINRYTIACRIKSANFPDWYFL